MTQMIATQAGRWFLIEKEPYENDLFIFRETYIQYEDVGRAFGEHICFAKHFENEEIISGTFEMERLRLWSLPK